MQNNSRTLLDQILASCRRTSFESGTIITDLSDHFPTFILSPPEKQKNGEKTKTYTDRSLTKTCKILNDWSMQRAGIMYWPQMMLMLPSILSGPLITNFFY